MTRKEVDVLISSMCKDVALENFPIKNIPQIDDAARPIYWKKSRSNYFVKNTKHANDGEWVCSNGFDDKYEKPKSKGGEYVRVEDINALYLLGALDIRNKLIGCSELWDENEMEYLDGYAKFASRRNKNGQMMVSITNNNTNEIPEDGTPNKSWGIREYFPYFSNAATSDTETPTIRIAGTEFYDSLPTTRTTKNFLWCKVRLGNTIAGTTYSCLVRFVPMVGEYSKTSQISASGQCIVKLSEYNDIYENQSHKDSYICIGSCLENQTTGSSSPYGYLWNTPQFPINSDKDYYIYLEYTNGCAAAVRGNEKILSFTRFDTSLKVGDL